MNWTFVLFVPVVLARLRVLDVPLQSGGTGTICGDSTCSYCCLEGYVCATFLPDCAYISTDNSTERTIFIIFASFYGLWVSVWLGKKFLCGMNRRKKIGGK